MDDVLEPEASDIQLPRVLAALADANRLTAVRFVVQNGESWCTQVREQAMLPMTKSTFSHHLRILREAGVITKRIEGAKGYMCVRRDDLNARFPGLLDSIVTAVTDQAPLPA
jgi:DNA-binding transcriptional ArsR family regulator